MKIGYFPPAEQLIVPEVKKEVNGDNAVNSFENVFTRLLDQVQSTQTKADEFTQALVAGNMDNIHDVAVAMEQAKLSLQLAVQVRNKIIEAYQEVMRMQV